MDLGAYASYPLPENIRQAFGVDTAQQLADQLGITAASSPDLAREADVAWAQYKKGEFDAVRSFMTGRLGMTEERADSTLSRLQSA